MKLRSITFRCTNIQLRRLQQAMLDRHSDNRTRIISEALEEFLDFAEQEDIKKLDLFALVKHLDDLSAGHPFAAEA